MARGRRSPAVSTAGRVPGLAYYEEYPDEIDRHIEENSRMSGEWHRHYPGIVPPRPEE
jgi:hypothetical protein